VKARASLDAAAEAVLPRQQQRIAAAAEAWLATYPNPKITDMRFDAILVAPRTLPRHIEGAFETA
jgi:putative endonuclease